MSAPSTAPIPPIDLFVEFEHLILNHWLWIILLIVVLVQYFLLKHSLKKIASCQLGFLAFLIHHATSVFGRIAALLRHLADELEKSDRLDQEKPSEPKQ
jgi:hypothetical protein